MAAKGESERGCPSGDCTFQNANQVQNANQAIWCSHFVKNMGKVKQYDRPILQPVVYLLVIQQSKL